MRNCEKCGKANQPTRKFCIRCGASLLKKDAPKEKAPLPTATAPEVQVTAATPPSVSPPPASEDEKWVKPSSVAKDRVRAAGGLTKPKSEFEKAKEAFAKAETVGIDEADGSGVVETRMLRASEVKELLEGPGMMEGVEDIPPPRMMEGSEPLPPEAVDLMPPTGPTASQIEESILGARSAYIEHPPEPEPEPEPEPMVAPPIDEDMIPQDVEEELTADYEMDGKIPVLEATTAEEETEPELTYDEEDMSDTEETSFTPAKVETAKPKPEVAPAAVDADLDLVIACPDCGKVINVDMFEYPKEVYSKMGAARLKQARFLVVQGKPGLAMDAVRKARALYEKADDKKGLKDVLRLVESLAQVD
ncbi:MAG: hypothetical protein ACFFDQ_05950 [Candidatus Thorarchaeota archaeon]